MAANWARAVGDLDRCSSGDGEKWVNIRHVVKMAPAEHRRGQEKDTACFFHLAEPSSCIYRRSRVPSSVHRGTSNELMSLSIVFRLASPVTGPGLCMFPRSGQGHLWKSPLWGFWEKSLTAKRRHKVQYTTYETLLPKRFNINLINLLNLILKFIRNTKTRGTR